MDGFSKEGWVWITMIGPEEWEMTSPVMPTEQTAEQWAAGNMHWALMNRFTQQKLIQVSVFESSAVVQ